MSLSQIVQVAVPCPLNRLFSYASAEPLAPGVRVLVPFGPRQLVGVVVACEDQTLSAGSRELVQESYQLKEIRKVLDPQPVYSASLLELGRWMSQYYHHPLGEVLKAMLPAGHQQVTKGSWHLTPQGITLRADELEPAAAMLRFLFPRKTSLSEARLRVKLREWRQRPSATAAPQDWEQLVQAGFVVRDSRQAHLWRSAALASPEGGAEEARPVATAPPPPLTAAQAAVVEVIIARGLEAAEEQAPKPFLLFGVTGSGKTEVYLRLIAHLHSRGTRQGEGGSSPGQTLVLVPEISLTPQMTRIFAERFPGQVAVVHSALSDAERWRQLERIRSQQASILIGPRSAVFAPFAHLCLILVDEEHDSSYKQNSQLSYNGRDIAVLRARMEKACVVLGSATPSLESYWNAQTGRYQVLELKERISQGGLPLMEVIGKKPGRYGVDLGALASGTSYADPSSCPTEEPPQGFAADRRLDLPLASEIMTALQEVLAKGEQAMVIVNRRGYAYYLVDRISRETVLCPHCSISLTLHLLSDVLRCHYCDYQTSLGALRRQYPQAQFFAVGHGSQKIEHALRAALPGVRLARLDSDVVAKRERLGEILAEFRAGSLDLLVGTQILAKGHDFPKVTLVVMLEVDQMLNLPDFRAGERTFQLMVQAAGRAGRAEHHGRVLVQTARAEHEVVKAGLGHDYVGFAKRELAFRRAHDYPPFGRLIVLEFTSPREPSLQEWCDKIETWLRRKSRGGSQVDFEALKVLGPAIPSIEKIRNRYRRTMILSAREPQKVHGFLEAFLADFSRLPPGLRLSIDVDPQSML